MRPLVERRLSGNADFIILLLGISALTRLKDEPEEVKGRSDRLIEKSDQGGKIRRLEKNKIVFEKKWMKKIVVETIYVSSPDVFLFRWRFLCKILW